jgi:hypothetical protein
MSLCIIITPANPHFSPRVQIPGTTTVPFGSEATPRHLCRSPTHNVPRRKVLARAPCDLLKRHVCCGWCVANAVSVPGFCPRRDWLHRVPDPDLRHNYGIGEDGRWAVLELFAAVAWTCVATNLVQDGTHGSGWVKEVLARCEGFGREVYTSDGMK